ncbi:caspase family protein [Microcoleus sp. FACHB-672]|uniref:caspase family protein n=1 Tax=Microcoleus sp. FACHB-672 TaxID=2692825 RepID=UPI001689669F|nr:caspase family protein [Microcoleus sp. FACHB-672]MBD2039784.1 caspase family protein [Microcoleus sp. FACHB-672]
MSRLKRRQFIQFSASVLTSLGLSQLDIQRQGLRYAKSLAQSTPRKLALLVGINGYPDNPLQGCITDADLQQQLLIHRFGFNPADIVLVTDTTDVKPTRAGILQGFEEHLIKQAKPGDVVVFHYSGHGSQVFDPDSGFPDQLNSTFVPINREVSQKGERAVVSDIMGETLFLLMSNLKTENVTVILDSCHSGGGKRDGGGKRGNLTIRAISGGNDIDPSPMEREYQRQLISRLGLTPEQVKKLRQESIAKGVVIASAARDELAADTPFDGFHAGAFTYALTQYLWQATGNEGVSSVVANVSRSTTQISGTRQVPEFEVKKGTDNARKPTFFLNKSVPPAEAVITKIEGDTVEFWLGGIEPRSIAAFNKGAVFLLLDEHGQNLGVVQMESRDPKNGLIGWGKLLEIRQRNNLKPGLLLQEQARSIPENLALRIGLDESLATGGSRAGLVAIPKIPRLEPTPLGQTEVHYILGRMTEARVQELQKTKQQEIPAIGSVGLYDQGLDLIPGSFGTSGESVIQAVDRLKAKFRSLLAARLVKLTLNADSSRMNVSAKMRIVDGTGKPLDVVAQEFTVRGESPLQQTQGLNQTPAVVPAGAVTFENSVPGLPVGTRVQLEVENQEKGDLYVTVLVISPEGDMFVIFPNNWTAGIEAAIIQAGQTRKIPDSAQQDQFKITVAKPLGTAEVLVIASATPIREALKVLKQIANSRGQRSGPVALEEDSTKAIDTLLGDLDRGSRGGNPLSVSYDPNTRTVNTAQLAALSITFQVVEV